MVCVWCGVCDVCVCGVLCVMCVWCVLCVCECCVCVYEWCVCVCVSVCGVYVSSVCVVCMCGCQWCCVGVSGVCMWCGVCGVVCVCILEIKLHTLFFDGAPSPDIVRCYECIDLTRERFLSALPAPAPSPGCCKARPASAQSTPDIPQNRRGWVSHSCLTLF